MIDNFDECLDFVLSHEGGFSNHPKDPGGATNLGITRSTWQAWVGHSVTIDEMKTLTKEQVTPLYRKRYWDVVKADRMPSGVDLCLFDSAVNQGPAVAVMTLQKILGTHVDAIIGPATMELVGLNSPVEIIKDFCTERRRRYSVTPNFSVFGKGWTRRANECEHKAMDMLSDLIA